MTLLLGSMSNVGVYSQALRDVGFQCLVSGGSTFSASYEVGLIKAILRFFARLLDDEALYEILSSPLFSIDDEVLLFLVTRYDREGKPHRRSLSEGFLAWNGDQVGTFLSDDEVMHLTLLGISSKLREKPWHLVGLRRAFRNYCVRVLVYPSR